MTDLPALDRYSLVARWTPATLLAAPVSVTLLLGLPTIANTAGKVVAVMLALGLPIVIGQLVRDAGRRVQERLYEDWRGAPTAHLLRDRLSRDDAVGERLRRQLCAVVGDYPPVPAVDAAATTGDDVYEAITGILRSRTRQRSAFPTVFDELVHYGFWRNLYAVRAVGLCAAGAAAAAAGVMAGVTASGILDGRVASWIIAALIDVVTVVGWALLRSTRVRAAGDRYAEALLGAVESISSAAAT